jgi:phosphohistidine phosphatase
MILYLVRHAWAEDRSAELWPDDSIRPLTNDGAKRFKRFAKRLVRNGLEVQRVLTSPTVRTVQTAEILADRLGHDAQPQTVDALAPGAQLAAVLAAIRPSDDESQAWVGHAPDVGQLLGALIGDSAARIDFAKGAVARIDFKGPAAAGQGELRWLATAKLLGE